MSSFTPTNNALPCAQVQEIEPTPEPSAPDLIERLNAISVNSDCFEFLELLKDLATAHQATQHAVALWCDVELRALDAQLETDDDRA